jgi:hypothetical protein
MVTQDLKVRLIEVNVSPDVSRSTPVTSRLVQEATTGLLDLVVDQQQGGGSSSSSSSSSSGGGGWELWWEEEEEEEGGGEGVIITPEEQGREGADTHSAGRTVFTPHDATPSSPSPSSSSRGLDLAYAAKKKHVFDRALTALAGGSSSGGGGGGGPGKKGDKDKDKDDNGDDNGDDDGNSSEDEL